MLAYYDQRAPEYEEAYTLGTGTASIQDPEVFKAEARVLAGADARGGPGAAAEAEALVRLVRLGAEVHGGGSDQQDHRQGAQRGKHEGEPAEKRRQSGNEPLLRERRAIPPCLSRIQGA